MARGERGERGGTAAGSARRTALEILCEVDKGKGLERLLEERLSAAALDARDRALATHLVQGTIRLRKRIDWGIGHYLSGSVEDLPAPIRNTLRLAFYQLLYLDRIPERAVVDEHVSLARAFGHRGTAGLVNAVLRSFLRAGRRIPGPAGGDEAVRIAIETSHPEWMIRRWVGRYGPDETRRLAEANNRVPELAVRVNRLRATPDRLIERLARAGFDATPGTFDPWVLHLGRSARVQDLPGFEEGWFQVQDESSALVGRLAAPKPGERVLDLCCGVGGKTTHLAELTADRGVVVGLDRATWRLRKLGENCRRLGIGSVRAVCGDATRPAARPVDLVLLDAPCSGTGVLGKRADARWQRREEDIPRLAELQRTMLAAAAGLVRGGGRLVYSVCSLEPEEGVEVVARFLQTHAEFRVDEAPAGALDGVVDGDGFLRSLPHRHGMDGMFGARLRKVGP